MKSVTIKNKRTNEVLVKIIRRKNGVYDLIKHNSISDNLTFEVRDDKNRKILFKGEAP
jgi:hypothetical protein